MEEVKIELLKKVLEEKKIEDLQVYDVQLTSPLCSYIIVGTMLNGRHGKSLCDACCEVQEKLGLEVRHIEGTEMTPWILIDLSDVIIHLFTKEERSRVNLEQLIAQVTQVNYGNKKED